MSHLSEFYGTLAGFLLLQTLTYVISNTATEHSKHPLLFPNPHTDLQFQMVVRGIFITI